MLPNTAKALQGGQVKPNQDKLSIEQNRVEVAKNEKVQL